MANAVQMPALSPTMKEGKITKWLKKEGDKVSSGDAIAECETDKSNLEIEAYDDGVLLKILVQEGETTAVGAPIAYVGEKGEKVEAPPAGATQPAETAKAPEAPKPAAAQPAAKPAPQQGQVVQLRRNEPPPAAASPGHDGGRLRASPLAKKMASETGLDLAGLQGSGPQGRIIKRDIEQAIAEGGAARQVKPSAPFAAPSFERREPEAIALTGMRKVIAQRMVSAKQNVPHFYLTVEVEMDAVLKIREEAKALESKISVNDIVIKAAAAALRKTPKLNVSYQGDHVLQYHNVDLGIAVALEDGLITPVLRDADLKGLSAISAEARSLAERARKRALKPEEYTGGSLTISNLGMYGVDTFQAIINEPQAAILAVGAAAEKAVARKGELVVRKIMSATLSVDHRAADGAIGAEFLREFKALLEHPMRLLF